MLIREECDLLPGINQLVFISSDNSNNFTLKTRVADISEERLAVELPIDKESGRLKIIIPGTKIKVWYAFDDYGQYVFETEVVEFKKGQIPLLIINKPLHFERMQRRDYLRVSASIEAAIKLVNNSEKQFDWRVVRTIDISGGGMQFLLPNFKIDREQHIKGWIAIPYKNGTIEHAYFNGKVTRVRQPNNNPKIYLISIKFIEMHETTRGKIVRYCYEKQVEINRKVQRTSLEKPGLSPSL